MIPAEESYPARAESWTIGRTKGGDLILAIMFVIVDCAYRGTRVQWDCFLTGKPDQKTGKSAWEKASATMRVMGWDGDPADLCGMIKNTVHVRIKHREWGTPKRVHAEVAWVNPLPRARTSGELPADKWADTIRELMTPKAPYDPTTGEVDPPSADGPGEDPFPTDDDLPF